jgi:hypothetical protein
MAHRKGPPEPGLTISYETLGTIHIKELREAIIEDIFALIDWYHVQYVKNARIKLEVTNEYGEQLNVTRSTGGRVTYMDTHHYRPACKDYDL